MQRYYSDIKKSLVYCGSASTAHFWDQHWNKDLTTKFTIDSFVVGETQKHLPKSSKVLEGGCGRGNKVYSLEKAGYDTYGVDFAQKTVDFLTTKTNLNVQLADIRNLPFPNSTFDGYWSLGVIEHFEEGIEKPVQEIERVLKPGGYLFLTVPYMSPLRKILAKNSKYELKNEEFNNFYQYLYPAEHIVQSMNKMGFQLVKKRGMDAVKGIKDELHIPGFKLLYKSQSLFAKIIKKTINTLLGQFAGHICYYVFQKKVKAL